MRAGEAILAQEAARVRSPGLGPSSVGEACDRKIAFTLRNVPHSNGVDKGAALVGTLLHEAWGIRMAAHLAALGHEHGVEVPVAIPGLNYTGHADLVDYTAREVWDLKTLGSLRFDKWEAGPPEYVWDQVSLYALGLGADGDWTMIVEALDREKGRWARWDRRFFRPQAEGIAATLRERNDRLRATPPDEATPVPSGLCAYCPWRTVCRGPDMGDPFPRVTAGLDPEVITLAAATYVALGDQIKGLEDSRERAKQQMGDAVGTFGDYILAIGTREAVDWKAARKLIVGDLPMKSEPTRVRTVRRAR